MSDPLVIDAEIFKTLLEIGLPDDSGKIVPFDRVFFATAVSAIVRTWISEAEDGLLYCYFSAIIADDFKPEAESAKPYMLRTSATKASRSRPQTRALFAERG